MGITRRINLPMGRASIAKENSHFPDGHIARQPSGGLLIPLIEERKPENLRSRRAAVIVIEGVENDGYFRGDADDNG